MKYYAVAVGRQTGVVESWDEAKALVIGFKGAIHKAFATREAALEFVQLHGSQSTSPKPVQIQLNPISVPNGTQNRPGEARQSHSDASDRDRSHPPGRGTRPQSRNGGNIRWNNRQQTMRKQQRHTELALSLNVSVV
ncbi:Caulimovirus viroplasmin-domain-containing protein [Dactylonectria estremocensis]|uniref:Ribonuclease H n=1 Tax=Dactylonectria estremocensis TaxID=1079267 RepID=A0A9P9IUT6_9HYPO|nr:Caulimovirus viroplasmin-domain-containing protein [Dactylonectria estremocensis]